MPYSTFFYPSIFNQNKPTPVNFSLYSEFRKDEGNRLTLVLFYDKLPTGTSLFNQYEKDELLQQVTEHLLLQHAPGVAYAFINVLIVSVYDGLNFDYYKLTTDTGKYVNRNIEYTPYERFLGLLGMGGEKSVTWSSHDEIIGKMPYYLDSIERPTKEHVVEILNAIGYDKSLPEILGYIPLANAANH